MRSICPAVTREQSISLPRNSNRDWTSWTNMRGAENRWGIPLVTKVMRKEARHTQRWDRASGVPPDILEHLPPKNQRLHTLLLCALTSDFIGGCPPPPFHSLCQRVNLQLQLIKFLGNSECLNPNPSDGSLTGLTSLPVLLQLCIRLFTVFQPPESREA